MSGTRHRIPTLHGRLYRHLYRIRRVEEEIAKVYPTDRIKSPVHLSIGQEAVSVGVCDALGPGDVVFGTYRSHALYLAKGGDLSRMIAELYGKRTGCAKGKGGSMHLVDVASGVMGTSAVVGTTIPNAVGYAYAMRYRRRPVVVASFFGDGAVEEGVWHESLNFAALKRLPILFVCENNGYAIHARQASRQAVPDITRRARSYGIPTQRVADNDVLRLRARASTVVRAIRAGGGPRFIECMTYRWREHVGPNDDFELGYRSRNEADRWVRGDQLARLATRLEASTREAIEGEVEAEIVRAFEFAEQSPFPEADELHADLFKDSR